MKKKIEKAINCFFDSDLDIEIRIKKGQKNNNNKSNILIIESNASYHNGVRYGGQSRTIDMPEGADDSIYESISDLCGVGLNKQELIYSLCEIEKRGYVLN
jgi:hypothetical protein